MDVGRCAVEDVTRREICVDNSIVLCYDDLMESATESPTPRRSTWGAKRHYRHPDVRTRGICGLGYDWPSTISLTDDIDEATCPSCRFEMRKLGLIE